MLAALALSVALAAMSVGVVLSRNASQEQIRANLKARGTSSAGFLSAFIAQQAARESRGGERLLAGRKPSDSAFRMVVSSLGSETAVLLDRSGRLLDVAPANRAILGSEIAPHHTHLTQAVAGHVAVSGVVRSTTKGEPVVAVAVPYPTSHGRRVLSVAYPVAGSVLSIFVEHASTLKPHQVMLIDGDGRIIAASPSTHARTLTEANPALAHASAQTSAGQVSIAGVRSTFVVSAVPGTPWHLVMASPNYKMFASISGWAKWLPWIVVALVAVLGLAVLSLLLRSNAERARLAALSRKYAEAASTDSLTGLANRRSLQARLAQASAFASRYGETLSVLMIDLDHFKKINDTHGHEAGDMVLVAVAGTMRQVFRDSDIFGRWGGDEFLAVLPNTDADGAFDAGQRLCERIRETDLTEHDLLEPITLSVGCTSALGGTPSDLINQADESLFRSKRAGRSRVSVG